MTPPGAARPRQGKAPGFGRHLAPRLKIWLDWDDAFLMGPRYLRFLQAVERAGTIRAAGRAVGWSYRTCLNRIREMERVLGGPVLATTRGGRAGGSARLTDAARALVRVFSRWQRDMEQLNRETFRRSLQR